MVVVRGLAEAHLGGAVRLKDSPTLLGSLAVTDLPLRSVALLYRVPHSLLPTPGDVSDSHIKSYVQT